MIRRYVLSGCSGGGKSAMIAALAARGYQTFPEPGRIIVAEEIARGGTALPWVDTGAFVRRAMDMSLALFDAAKPGTTFYDRSFLEPLRWFDEGHEPMPAAYADIAATRRYADPAFLVPPWPEIFVTDAERQHGLDAAIAEYEGLLEYLPAKGYSVEIVPRLRVEERVDWLLAKLTA